MNINKYYQYYLTLHKHPKCKLLHFIGQWVTILFTIFVFMLNAHNNNKNDIKKIFRIDL